MQGLSRTLEMGPPNPDRCTRSCPKPDWERDSWSEPHHEIRSRAVLTERARRWARVRWVRRAVPWLRWRPIWGWADTTVMETAREWAPRQSVSPWRGDRHSTGQARARKWPSTALSMPRLRDWMSAPAYSDDSITMTGTKGDPTQRANRPFPACRGRWAVINQDIPGIEVAYGARSLRPSSCAGSLVVGIAARDRFSDQSRRPTFPATRWLRRCRPPGFWPQPHSRRRPHRSS